MIPKRVVVVGGDKALGRRIAAAALAAGATVEVVASVAELAARYDAEVFVVAAEASDPGLALLLAAAPPEAQVVPLLPANDLAGAVALLADVRVPAVLVSAPFEGAQLTAALTKILYGDLFGVEKVVPWGVKIHSLLVGDYQEKTRAIAGVAEFAEAMGVRRKYREGIEQVLDELLMNALYDAPVDGAGRPLFADVPIKERLSMRVEEKVVVQYACDGERFALSVRDAHGSLRKATVVSFLAKCLHASADGGGQIDRKTSGAGLGLYLIANAASQVAFHIFPSVATEVVCVFDLAAARLQASSLGLFEERLSSGKPASGPRALVRRRRRDDLVGPKPLPPTAARSLSIALTLSTLLLLVAVGLVVAPALRRPAPAALLVDSDPRGATIYLDGRSHGRAQEQLRIEGLEAGRTYALRATAPGRRDEERVIAARAGDQPIHLMLGMPPAGTLVIESEPPGAEVLLDGSPTGKVTPTELDPPGPASAVTLRKSGFTEQKLAISPPRPGERAVYRTRLGLAMDVASLSIDVVIAAAPPSPNGLPSPSVTPLPSVLIDGMAIMPPGLHHEALVKPGVTHRVAVSAPGFPTRSEEVRLVGGEARALRIDLIEGGTLKVSSNLPMRVAIDDRITGTTPLSIGLPEGDHKLTLFATRPLAAVDLPITIERGRTVEEAVDFGRVVVTAPGVTARPAGTKHGAVEVALPVGEQELTLVGPNGNERVRTVTVTAAGKTVIDSF